MQDDWRDILDEDVMNFDDEPADDAPLPPLEELITLDLDTRLMWLRKNIGRISKDARNSSVGFDFASGEKVKAVVRAALARYKIGFDIHMSGPPVFQAETLQWVQPYRVTFKDVTQPKEGRDTLAYDWWMVSPAKESGSVDKFMVGKSASFVLRYFFLTFFMVSAGDEQDYENEDARMKFQWYRQAVSMCAPISGQHETVYMTEYRVIKLKDGRFMVTLRTHDGIQASTSDLSILYPTGFWDESFADLEEPIEWTGLMPGMAVEAKIAFHQKANAWRLLSLADHPLKGLTFADDLEEDISEPPPAPAAQADQDEPEAVSEPPQPVQGDQPDPLEQIKAGFGLAAHIMKTHYDMGEQTAVKPEKSDDIDGMDDENPVGGVVPEEDDNDALDFPD